MDDRTALPTEEEVEKELAATRVFAERYAAANGLSLNSDTSVLDTVLRGLTSNKLRRGARYCPCRPFTGDPEKDRPKICPCKWHKEELERDGHCHCQLYFRTR